MKKEFVPYTEALELKKLGFDEECFGYYDHQIKELDTISSDVCERLCKHDTHIKAPTYSQSFRWFREKYKLRGLIEIGTHEYSFIIFDETTDSRKISSSMNGTYEEAELACLKKLIEIVEMKKEILTFKPKFDEEGNILSYGIIVQPKKVVQLQHEDVVVDWAEQDVKDNETI